MNQDITGTIGEKPTCPECGEGSLLTKESNAFRKMGVVAKFTVCENCHEYTDELPAIGYRISFSRDGIEDGEPEVVSGWLDSEDGETGAAPGELYDAFDGYCGYSEWHSLQCSDPYAFPAETGAVSATDVTFDQCLVRWILKTLSLNENSELSLCSSSDVGFASWAIDILDSGGGFLGKVKETMHLVNIPDSVRDEVEFELKWAMDMKRKKEAG